MAGQNVTVFYLQMLEHNRRSVPTPRPGVTVIEAKRPTVGYYRFLYDSVGRDYHWRRCKRLSDAELAAALAQPGNEVHVLFVDGVPAGFAEFTCANTPDIEMIQFGLMRDFIGQGLGKYFLQWTIDRAWSYHPQRFWLHTCTLDHPKALPNYQQAGFVLYKEEVIQRDLEREAELYGR